MSNGNGFAPGGSTTPAGSVFPTLFNAPATATLSPPTQSTPTSLTDINYWKLSYQVSPIFLTGTGALVSQFGGIYPLLALIAPSLFPQLSNIQSLANITTALADQLAPNVDDYGAWSILPGGTLVKQAVAAYPFANQWIAANATIRQPLTLSMIWDTPMRVRNAWAQKLMTMQNLKNILDTHNNQGGTFTVITPSYIYENLILTSVSDASRPQSPLPQNAWRFDFEKPLITMVDVQAAQSNLMSKITNGMLTNGQWSGVSTGAVNVSTQPQYAFGTEGIIPAMKAIGFGIGTPAIQTVTAGLSSPFSVP